jgi:transcriptional regulator with XRE-family HTH domain
MVETSVPETVTPNDLRELASALGCNTQRELAQALGITQARVSQILTGRHPVKPGALLTLISQLRKLHVQNKKAR